jgi:hypothetical protein
MTNKDGGPAFPMNLNPNEQPNPGVSPDGMSLRDYFAAKAMQGFSSVYHTDPFEKIAYMAYAQADAMLAERERDDE